MSSRMRGKRPEGRVGSHEMLAAAAGFGFFKSAQIMAYTTAMSSGSESFMLLSDIDFNIVSSFFIIGLNFAIAIAAYRKQMQHPRMPIVAPTLCFIATNLLSFSGLLDTMQPIPRLALICLMYAVGSVPLILAWMGTFADMESTVSPKAIALGMLVGAIFPLALSRSCAEVNLAAITCLAIVSMLLFRMLNRQKPADALGSLSNSDDPSTSAAPPASVPDYARSLASISNGLVCLLVLGCAMNAVSGFMLVGGIDFEGSASTSNLGMLIAQVVFCLVVHFAPRLPHVSIVYRILFPVFTGLLILWPFLGQEYLPFLSVALVMGHKFVSCAVMCLIVNEGARARLNPYTFMGIAIVLIRLSVLLGMQLGSLLGTKGHFDLPLAAVLVAALAIWILSFALLPTTRFAKENDLIESARSLKNAPRTDTPFDNAPNLDFEQIAERQGLTNREREILSYLARGRSATYIGKELYLSPNTVRGHTKNIYAKLSVHSKQELIDLVEQKHPPAPLQ